VFSTAEDNQSAVTIHVLQGERDMAGGNKSLGQFNLTDIPPAPRGLPQIEVTFDIDANGILHVTAKDKATGKENKIKIQASSGLTEAGIQRMVKDAEAHAEEDRKALDLVNARNQLEALVHSIRKSLKDYGDKLEAGEKERIESAMKDAEGSLKSEDKAAIDAKAQALALAAQKLGEKIYAETQAQAGGQQEQGAAPGDAGKKDDSNVVDAAGMGGFGDIFSDMFGEICGSGRAGGGRSTVYGGADLRYNLEISLEQAAHGFESKIRIPGVAACESCKGSGARPGSQPRTCPTCRGAGQVRVSQGPFSMAQTCPRCHGTGSIIPNPCTACGGTGRVK